MMSRDKQMIRIPTDPTHLTTDCIGLTSRPKKHRGRGRPKGSKSKTKTKRTSRKRSATESNLPHTDSYDRTPTASNSAGQAPKRKKRKPNRAHREQFPHHTDEDIRRQLALERKAKNRKSAQESRERRKKQEEYLNERLPKGLALKALLKSDKIIHAKSEDVHLSSSDEDDDDEVCQMKMILHQMVDNNAAEYDQYANVLQQKSVISDDLIFNVLSDYLDGSRNTDDDDDDDLHLETDHDPIHLQVIGEIESGIPLQVDDIPESATPNSFKATRGRKAKNNKNKHHHNRKVMDPLKTPPTLPQIVGTELPPPVFGVGSVDFNIDSESAVSLYPVPQDSMANQYHFQSLYNVNAPQCIMKRESAHNHSQYPMYHPMNVAHINSHHHHPQIQFQSHHHSEQTPSTISTASTITASAKEDVGELQDKVLMSLMSQTQMEPIKLNQDQDASPLYTATSTVATPPIAPCLPHTPLEQMHFIHPLPARVPHSPIISVTAQQDTEETKQMLMNNGSSGANGRSSRSGNNLSNINNGEIVYDIESALDPMEEMRILSILVQIVQSFIIIICGMAMAAVNLSHDAMKNQYQAKINGATEDLRILVMDFMRKRVKQQQMTQMQWMQMQQHIIQTYLAQIMCTIKNHPLIPNTKTMDVSLHYQAYRQIAMEILQNMKQQAIQYQIKKEIEEEEEEDEEIMIGFDPCPAPIPAVIPMMEQKTNKKKKKNAMKIEHDVMNPLDLNSTTSTAINLRSICSEYQIHSHCLEEFQMNSHPMDLIHSVPTQTLTHLQLIKYKTNLQDKCFQILLGGNKLKEKD